MRSRTSTWFETKVKYQKTMEDGSEKVVSEAYVVDALSFTEAESAIIDEMSVYVSGELKVSGIGKACYGEIFFSDLDDDDKWYKAKVNIIDADQISGKEKKSGQYFLIAGADLERALVNLQKSLSTYVVPFEIASIADTTIMDVFPYFSDDAEERIPSNLKPLGEMEANTEEFE